MKLKKRTNEKRYLEIYHSDDYSYSDSYSDQPGRYQLHELRAGLRARLFNENENVNENENDNFQFSIFNFQLEKDSKR